MSPKVFVSYSHDSDEHSTWVLQLATDLRAHGVDVTLDQWDLRLGEDVGAFMSVGIRDAERVLLVCTEEYVKRAESGLGGVGYERLIVTAEVVANISTAKFIPIIRNNPEASLPTFLGLRRYIDFTDEASEDKLPALVEELHGVSESAKPPLGPNPFSSVPAQAGEAGRAGPSGVATGGGSLLDGDWFSGRATKANDGLATLGLRGAMELRFSLHDSIGKSQLELLSAVRESRIQTFGWPIGVMLENQESYRPKPTSDGIETEVNIADRTFSGAPSYDYWSARTNGDFYLLQSLFEDTRAEDRIFFNTRIVRVAESLLFCSRLYEELGVAGESPLSVRVSHFGLGGRQLASSTPSRNVYPRTTQEDASVVEFVEELGRLEPHIVQDTKRVLAPLFMIFDFAEFGDEIYEDIVERFRRGEVS